MPAPLAKGILITLTLLTALGAAVLANPQVQAWIDEQRRKVAEALRSLGNELDPQQRRQAEAFAFEGRIPGQRPEAARRESAAARDAVARATGRDEVINLDETSRRLNRVAKTKLNEADEAERRRLGREYLARRNQEMLDAKEKAKMRHSTASIATPPPVESGIAEENPWNDAVDKFAIADQPSTSKSFNLMSFDSLVDQNGSLKPDNDPQDDMEKTLELPSPPKDEPRSAGKMKLAVLEEPSSSIPTSAFESGSRWANPFGDEFELEDTGYATPKPQAPAVPPKIALEDPDISVPDVQITKANKESQPSVRQIPIDDDGKVEASPADMSYDEQLARAVSLSLAEEERKRQSIYAETENEDFDLAAAISASLADKQAEIQQHVQQTVGRAMQQANAAVQRANEEVQKAQSKVQQRLSGLQLYRSAPEQNEKTPELVDLSSDPATSVPEPNIHYPSLNSQGQSSNDDSDSLYCLSPEYKAAKLAPSVSAFQPPPPYDEENNFWQSSQNVETSPALVDVTDAHTQNSLSRSGDLLDLHEYDNPTQVEIPPTPSTAMSLSPKVDRDDIVFSTDSDDDFASAAASMSHTPATFNPQAPTEETQRRPSTASFATDPNSHDDPEETTSLIEHASETSTASLIDVHEHAHSTAGSSNAGTDAGMEFIRDYQDSSSSSDDEEWASGIRTPGSEWTDVGSEVSEEEVGGQDSRRLASA
ncbi:hypothetical protein AAFC00_002327 [Neodothiora populina]|uniref:Uncharacterized protein n=1 Tax=Neodothiora populina TaxID=2781224 RepID=A0ABR3PH20_9PEZI